MFVRIVGIRKRVIGLEKFDPKIRYIFMANHTNLLDAFVVYSSFKQIGRGLEKAAHFSWPIYGWVLKAIKMVPIPSEGGTGRTKKIFNAMRYTMEYLKKRKYLSLVILPEGTRTRTGLLGKFKRGGFLIAIETGIPIVPITVNGLFNIQQKGGFLLNPGRVEVIFHKPIETMRMTKNDASALRKKIREIIKSKHAMEIAASK
jgi:1-acyl-sn-glycerol-3-phosphate acyltransferase